MILLKNMGNSHFIIIRNTLATSATPKNHVVGTLGASGSIKNSFEKHTSEKRENNWHKVQIFTQQWLQSGPFWHVKIYLTASRGVLEHQDLGKRLKEHSQRGQSCQTDPAWSRWAPKLYTKCPNISHCSQNNNSTSGKNKSITYRLEHQRRTRLESKDKSSIL